ncbi:hypothetical protein ACXR0O_10855 [Verrucomicrobiota bacterium sgz303538]
MPVPSRFILWPNDSALDAVDRVARDISDHIDASIAECDESDTCWLNDVIAYMCCLSAVGNAFGGLTCQYDKIEAWRTQVLQVFEWAWARDQKTEEYFDERKYICSVLNSLFEAADRSTVPSAQKPWPKA